MLTTGTFLNGLIHIGEETTPAGRVGEAPSLGFPDPEPPGFCPRPAQDRDAAAAGRPDHRLGGPGAPGRRRPAGTHVHLTARIDVPQVACHITDTTAASHALIRANLHRSPIYCGRIESRGPRYCPSIEDKVVRFADKARHQIFLEPEGLDDPTVYPNGISTSLPREVQQALLQTIPGLEQADDPAGLCHRI